MSPASPRDAALAGIAGRQFVTTRKGYDTNEVRGYLRELAALVEELQASETAQRERADQAEARLGQPDQLDEARMVELLGKETTRVLDAARVAAVDIRRKAEEAASRLISEANDEAHRLRAEAEAAMAAQRIELRSEVESMRQQAASELARRQAEGDELVAEMQREAEAEAEALRSRAQEEGRQMVTEAQVVRERMLRDLSRRRHGAREQLERLNAARDRLLAAYEVVRRTVDTATGELHVALPEAKVAGEAAMRRVHGEPEPSVEELDDLVAMARIAGLLDPRLEQSILDEEEDEAVREEPVRDEPVAPDDADPEPVVRAEADDEPPVAEVTGRRDLVPIGEPVVLPEDAVVHAGADDDVDDPVLGMIHDVVDVVAVEATVVDAADAVDALRELAVDDEPGETGPSRGLGAEVLDVDGRLFRLDESEPLHLNGSATRHLDQAEDDVLADEDEYDHEVDGVNGYDGADRQGDEDDEDDVREYDADRDEDEYEVTGYDDEAVYEEDSDHIGAEADADVLLADDASDDEPAYEADDEVAAARPGSQSVDELFARLRAGRDEPAEDSDESVDVELDERVAVGVVSTTVPETARPADRAPSWLDRQSAADAGPGARDDQASPGESTVAGRGPGDRHDDAQGRDPVDHDRDDDGHSTADQPDQLRQRDEALANVEQNLARKLKRVLADEQNEVLDLLRRTKVAVADADEVLPDAEAHTEQYVAVARDGLGTAAAAGAVQVADVPTSSTDCEGLAAALGQAVVAPLRERIARSFVESGSDVEELTGRLRSLYREWKAQRIGDAVRHFTVVAYAQGAYGALPDGTPLRWLVDRSGEPCADADDNALAGTVPRGEPFPTGDHCPPAHPGCRCLVVPAP